MASSTVHQCFVCHFCADQFRDCASLTSHFPQCQIKNPVKKNAEMIRLPRLEKIDRDLLQMLKLHRLNDKSISKKHNNKQDPYQQLPLSMGYFSSSKQASFDDSMCNPYHSSITNGEQTEQDISFNILNNKISSSCHIYKYSRREQKNFYASVKRARLKKQYSLLKRSHTTSLIFNHKNSIINLPTRITSRQRFNTNSNNSFPLIFDPNFNSLVQLSKKKTFQNYFSDLQIYFHLLNSIASQEFQIIVNSNDNQHHVSFTALSFVNILRQTMTDYSINLQKTFKRNYFQSFQQHDPPILAPAKLLRVDRPTTTTTDIPIVDSQHSEIQTNPILSTATTITQKEKCQINNVTTDSMQLDLIIPDHQQSTDRTNTVRINDSSISIIEMPTPDNNSSPILLTEYKIEPEQIDPSLVPNERTRIRVINGSNDAKKQAISRKKLSNSLNKLDENSLIKSIRMSTRKTSIKTEPMTDICPPYQAIPVILSSKEITKQWLTHNVFYRCHACSHEEFFGVLSRECMRLHVSSKHGNMEENFKQRLETFLNNKGHSVKIFQHYLKWQQPWSDKEVEQIFKLSNK